MIKPLLGVARRQIILFGTAKFAIGLVIGFALGVYFLPILTEEKGLDIAAIAQLEASAEWSGTLYPRPLRFGRLSMGRENGRASNTSIWLEAKIPPGPDYRLYLTPSLATNKASFMKIKDQSVKVGEVKAFSNFSLDVTSSITVGDYPAVLIWCEAFGEFITAAAMNLGAPLHIPGPLILIFVSFG